MKSEHSASTGAKAAWMLTRYAYPFLSHRAMESIGPTHILEALRAMESAGKLETIHRLRARISEVFRYAISTGPVQSDPTRDLKGAVKAKPKTQHHAALIVPKEVGALMRGIPRLPGHAGDVCRPTPGAAALRPAGRAAPGGVAPVRAGRAISFLAVWCAQDGHGSRCTSLRPGADDSSRAADADRWCT